MNTFTIDSVDVVLSHPVPFEGGWSGQAEPLRQLLACWLTVAPGDLPLTPRLLGPPGIGKTTLAMAAARTRSQPVYVMQCTADTRPEDLLITPVLSSQGRISYHASPLLSAVLTGGIAVLDEGNRMSEKSWASLAGLLDNRRMVESVVAAITVSAHREFRAVVTMNEDSSTFEIPDYETALRAERERERREGEGRTVTAFYGLKVVSDRICFVLDTSGSMETPSGGTTRIEAAKEQLLTVLDKYPEGDLFNVIFFSSDAFPWQDQLAEMTKKTRKAALDYVDRQRAGGATALYDALELAFEDRRIDTIFLLTDGVPSGGKVDDPGQIRQEVKRWNEARHVRINCISVGGPSPLLKGLAADTGGEYKEVK